MKKIFQMQFQYRQEKLDRIKTLEEQSKEEKRQAEQERQRIILYASIGGSVLMLCLAIFIYRGYRQKQKANEIITLQKREVEEQKYLIEDKQKEILDSIHYAKRIQSSLLPTEKYIEKQIKRLKKDK